MSILLTGVGGISVAAPAPGETGQWFGDSWFATAWYDNSWFK